MSNRSKIITLGLAVICIIPIIITNQNKIYEENEVENSNYNDNTTYYLSSYNFSQKNLKLNHEFVQYKIIFYKNTTIDYEYFLKFRVKDLYPLYYLVIFTDGKKGVLKREINGKFYEAPIIGQSMIPQGILVDINFNRFHISIGKLLFKILPIGNIDNIKGNIEVKAGTEWFLTMAVYHKKIDEKFYINLESKEPSFDVINLNRDNKIEYFNSANGDLQGIYCGIKILSHGCSYSKNLEKTIVCNKGSIIIFSSIGHIRGEINVEGPDGQIYNKNTRRLASFQYYGNQTGTWKFSSSGIGFGWKHIVSLFYIDVDPHYYSSDWDK